MEHWLAWKNRTDGSKGETEDASLEDDLQQYLAGPYDKYRHRGLAQRLLKLAEPLRVVLIEMAIDQNPALGLKFARSCLHHPKYFEIILLRALQTYDEETIHAWVECFASVLSHYQVLRVLKQHIDTYPEAVAHMFVLLPPIRAAASAGRDIHKLLKQTLIAKSLIVDEPR